VRRVLVLLLTSVFVAVLAACGSGSPDPEPTGIGLVSVSGEAGKKPKVSFAKPFNTTKTESKVLTKGKGEKVAANDNVVVNYVGINGRDGKEFDTSWQKGRGPTVFSLREGGLIPGFLKGMIGKTVGDRVLITIPSQDGYAQGNQQAGIKKGDDLIFVLDLMSRPLQEAKGEAVTPPDGLPTVKMDKTSKLPVDIKVPKTDAPGELVAEPLIRGEGAKVDAKSTVTFHYTAANWRTGKPFVSSWSAGSPQTLPLAQTTVTGLREGITGQTVGSLLILVVPPDKGFGRALEQTDVKKTDTVVFVIDILDAT
jgi:FKBP-type peptidyl-prolyl cis-trans isomerase